jgi:hypothetical protein
VDGNRISTREAAERVSVVGTSYQGGWFIVRLRYEFSAIDDCMESHTGYYDLIVTEFTGRDSPPSLVDIPTPWWGPTDGEVEEKEYPGKKGKFKDPEEKVPPEEKPKGRKIYISIMDPLGYIRPEKECEMVSEPFVVIAGDENDPESERILIGQEQFTRVYSLSPLSTSTDSRMDVNAQYPDGKQSGLDWSSMLISMSSNDLVKGSVLSLPNGMEIEIVDWVAHSQQPVPPGIAGPPSHVSMQTRFQSEKNTWVQQWYNIHYIITGGFVPIYQGDAVITDDMFLDRNDPSGGRVSVPDSSPSSSIVIPDPRGDMDLVSRTNPTYGYDTYWSGYED